VGQWVCQRLLNRPMASLEVKGCDKLGPCYFRPFQISEKIGTVAYRLRLPTGVCIHDVFHVALLKRFFSEPPQAPLALPSLHHGRVCVEPERVLKCCLARGQHELLVQWKGMATAEMTWMPLEEFRCVYPTFQLEGELLVQWGEMSCGVYGTPNARTSATPNREQPRMRARPTNTRHQRQMISSVSYSVKTKLVSPTFGGYKPGHQVRGGIVFYLGLACISCAPFILMRRRTALIQKFS
jgi:hypothetical protein